MAEADKETGDAAEGQMSLRYCPNCRRYSQMVRRNKQWMCSECGYREEEKTVEVSNEMLSSLKEQNEIMSRIICSRNKLINDLLELPSLSRSDFSKGLRMRRENWENDKVFFGEVKSKNKVSEVQPEGREER